jgi:hypothetical protein
MRRVALSCAVLLLVLSPLIRSQEPLTNDSVVKLTKAGLSEEVILGMVKLQPAKYSLGLDDIVALKKAGVSDKVIAAMVGRAQGGGGAKPAEPASSAASAPAGAPNEIGVYYKKNDKWEEMLPEVVNWKTGGVLKHIGTAGIVKGDVNGRLEGPNSRNSVKTPLEFLIYTAEGTAITEYQLLRLRAQPDGREFRTVTGGILHTSGGATRDVIPFEGKKIASRTYVIVLPNNLGAGEYGFLAPGAAASSHASAQLGKMYTFRLLE